MRGDERRLASALERAVPSHGHIEHQLVKVACEAKLFEAQSGQGPVGGTTPCPRALSNLSLISCLSWSPEVLPPHSPRGKRDTTLKADPALTCTRVESRGTKAN